MKIFVQPNEGHRLVASMKCLPLTICIMSEESVEVAEKIDINSVALVRTDDPEFFLGFSRSITSVLGGTMVIDEEHPYCTVVDPLVEDDDHEALIIGEYQVRVEATVFRKESKGFVAEILRASIPMLIVESE